VTDQEDEGRSEGAHNSGNRSEGKSWHADITALAGSSIVWRGAGAAVGLIALLVTRTGVTGVFDEILGLTLVLIAVLEQLPRLLDGESPAWWRSALLAAAGAAIFLWPSETAESLGIIAASAIGIYGGLKLFQGFRTPDAVRRRDRLARGVLMIALAAVIALFPEATLRLVVLSAGVMWVFEGALVASAIGRTDPTDSEEQPPIPTQENLNQWLVERQLTRAEQVRVDEVLFFDGPDSRKRLFRFGVLMALATALATFGVAADSTAVVIGAMLIAPLMTPILATGSALLHGWPGRALRSSALVLGATVGAITIAWMLAAFIPDLTTVVANDEVTSRTAPNLIDLAIAIAAGAAGAFAVTRPDISETLPGVAVAIALVPPLAAIGVTLHAGNGEQALGALLLYTTNLVAILAMASIVFVLTGYAAWSRLRSEQLRVRASYATVAAGVVLLLIPLGLTARSVIREASVQRTSQELVDDWLGDSPDLRLTELEVSGRRVMVTLQGPGEAPPSQQLHDSLTDELGETVLEVRVVPEVLDIIGEE
jgi:uncharacterized hydrophobic protein (TIGR00271 family)